MNFDLFEFPVNFEHRFDLGDKGRYRVSVLAEKPRMHNMSRDKDTGKVTAVEVAVMNPEGERLVPAELPVNGSLDKYHGRTEYDQGIYSVVPVNVAKAFLKRMKKEQRKANERKREHYREVLNE